MDPLAMLLVAAGMPPAERQRSLMLIVGCLTVMAFIFVLVIWSEPKERRAPLAFFTIGGLIGWVGVLVVFLFAASWLLS